MSITLPDPEPNPPRTTPTEVPLSPGVQSRAARKLTCYFGVYPHGMGKEGQVTKILSSEHLDRE